MKKLVIIPNVNKDRDFAVTDKVVTKLLSLGMNVFIANNVGYDREGVIGYDELPEGIDLIVVVGGDGSVIDASNQAIANDIPMLGVNLGRLGYLTEIEPDGMSVLDGLVSGNYSISEKMLLEVDFADGKRICERYAVNDVTISRDGFLHIADIKIEDSIQNAVKLRVDGVILSTPQGSTAYSFSAGGPIVAHDVESILLTPVSPHSFFNRSVLFNSSDEIKITNLGDIALSVSIDGRSAGMLASGEYCTVRKAEKKVKLLTFQKNSMFSSLVKKMRILGEID